MELGEPCSSGGEGTELESGLRVTEVLNFAAGRDLKWSNPPLLKDEEIETEKRGWVLTQGHTASEEHSPALASWSAAHWPSAVSDLSRP